MDRKRDGQKGGIIEIRKEGESIAAKLPQAMCAG
jgi:hypothetical protein